MFPLSLDKMNQFGIEKTARIMPHDNNTGGFYIAKIRKLKFKDNEKEIDQYDNKVQKKSKKNSGLFTSEDYKKITPEIIESIKKDFNFDESFPFEQLICHVKSNRKISLISKKLLAYFDADLHDKMNNIYSGVCVFN